MGCDIHDLIQIKKDGKWVNSDFLGYRHRDYKTFAVIAGVRNRYSITPISLPRGLPPIEKDVAVSEIERILKLDPKIENFEDSELGDHSFSFLLAKELLEFNWDKHTNQGITYKEMCLLFFETFVTKTIKDLADKYGAENVRWVFGFDS